jgi:hypothetical protein
MYRRLCEPIASVASQTRIYSSDVLSALRADRHHRVADANLQLRCIVGSASRFVRSDPSRRRRESTAQMYCRLYEPIDTVASQTRIYSSDVLSALRADSYEAIGRVIDANLQLRCIVGSTSRSTPSRRRRESTAQMYCRLYEPIASVASQTRIYSLDVSSALRADRCVIASQTRIYSLDVLSALRADCFRRVIDANLQLRCIVGSASRFVRSDRSRHRRESTAQMYRRLCEPIASVASQTRIYRSIAS